MAAPQPALSTPGTRKLAAACRADVPALTRRLISAIFTDNPEWTDYTSVPRADLRDGCRRYLTRILDLLGGDDGDPERDEVAASIGRRRAEQGVPLEAMLRTFRLGGGIVWEALLDQADDVGPQEIREAGTAMWTVIDGLSSALVTAYRNTELEQVRRDERRRHALIEDLLAGRAHDATFAARAARELNLPTQGAYLVVAARGEGRPLQIGTETALAALGIRSVWHDRVDTTIGLVSVEGRDDHAVLQHLRPHVRGRAGASPAVPGLAQVDSAHALALIALQTLPGDTTGLVSLDERYPEALLVRSPDLTDLLLTHTLGPILNLPGRERDILLDTLAAWLAENCSAAHAAPRLHCHRNTVINRLQRISTLLGRPLEGQRSYVELSLALTALGAGGRTA
ncbi:helix-turn-helix domain-containing protein [Nocardia sp. CDC159]|uniref:Helix-turn-helix domain-containing protein n=1 Tax=Nocardia pulmonis TaxID=2951408 RepID=A0A9X2IY66_9NOCA|nr:MULTISPECIES: helix-turn-helix domain-containing protein [Nocardia]MCM6773576.1 helix-turn-helix domain-containing protein [Nocardia pulmonis]MCM6786463.1 helix-turn-helix domain-containing protein [Nocardia sp. CDC159]